MLSELEKSLDAGIKELIEKTFRKEIGKMELLEKREVFFVVYSRLALLLMVDFDLITELVVANITQNKAEELKQDILPQKPKESEPK